MKNLLIRQRVRSRTIALACCLTALAIHAAALLFQPGARVSATSADHLRSRIFIYDLRDGSSHLVYQDDSIWEAPNWSPDGGYLISNHNGGIYKLTLKHDSTAEPEKLAIPAGYSCNNDKALSPDGKKLAFSATPPGGKGSQVYVSDADGKSLKQMTTESPSFFHGWSPDGATLAFVAQRNGSGQYDIYAMPSAGGPEKQLNSNPHHDDGPDYSPDGMDLHQFRSLRQGSDLALSGCGRGDE